MIEDQVALLLAEEPPPDDPSICALISIDRASTSHPESPALGKLLQSLQELEVHPVLEPLLVIHGIYYDIRIESGVSESTFSFHALGHPRPSDSRLHPLDRWSQRLLTILGLDCTPDAGDSSASKSPPAPKVPPSP